MSELFQLIAEFKKAASLSNGTWDVVFNLNMDPANTARMVFLKGKTGYLTFKEGEARINDIEADFAPPIPKPKNDQKTPSQKLRDTIFVYWQKTGSSGQFEEYYVEQIEKIRMKYLNAIDEL